MRLLFTVLFAHSLAAAELPDEVQELLDYYCYDCHGYGKEKGDIRLDELDPVAHKENWERAWLNIRTGMMPPADGEPWIKEERQALLKWLEGGPLGIDRQNPDPGKVTIRRLNREDYRYTIHDLLGIDLPTAEHFPPDDTGYGFDNIGDVLSISPLLAERYLELARDLMNQAVPDNAASEPSMIVRAPGFTSPDDQNQTGRFIEFQIPQTVEAKRWIPMPGDYEIVLHYRVTGSPEATANTATFIVRIDGRELTRKELGWDFQDMLSVRESLSLEKGELRISLEIQKGNPPKPGQGELGVEVERLVITGPKGSGYLDYPDTYLRVIPREMQPTKREDWPAKARDVIRRFSSLAWRRPTDEALVERLGRIADEASQSHNTFEAGIRQAGTAILASPRFVLRQEKSLPLAAGETYPLIDEWTLANRLSSFLWNSLPDEELRRHAQAGTLRHNLTAQIERMMRDEKCDRFIRNFTGQWLQARDVEAIGMRPEVILGTLFNEGQRIFNNNLRRDMRLETEALFRYILLEKKPAIDLVGGNYTFLNKRLADFYEIPSKNLGEDFTKVEGRRGGILTQGTFLVVTSNPTRTSPVKRGLYVLDNLLGTPPPPAPPDVPELEESGQGNEALSMRELMVKHREAPECRSCHQRMDPIGLAFENFTALGTWRDRDGGAEIDPAGQLVTGEAFAGVDELKKILATSKRGDFHRCLAEKLLTYALGRGVESYDAPAIDEIIRRMEAQNGTLHEAIHAVIDSVPYQRTRP